MLSRICRFSTVSLCAVAPFAAFSAQWILDTSSTAAEKTIDGAGLWQDAARWKDGVIADGADTAALFWQTGKNWDNSGLRYTLLTNSVTVGSITRSWNNSRDFSTWNANRRVLLGGTNEIRLANTATFASLTGLAVYAPVRVTASRSMPRFYVTDFCGPYRDETQEWAWMGNNSRQMGPRFRRDCWADSPSEGITNIAPRKIRFDETSHMRIIAPRGVDASTGVWRTTAGETRLVAVGAANTVTVGSTVSGPGVPAGAFIRYLYPDGSIALSAPATADSGEEGVTLAFGAFRPKMYQRLDEVATEYHSGSKNRYGIWPMKYAEADDFTLELVDFHASSSECYLGIDTEAGLVPARFVLRNTSRAKYPLHLAECDVEFAAPTDGTACGYPKAVQMFRAGATARVTVAEGLSARIGALTEVIGTFVKRGGGTLTAAVSAADTAGAATGALVVEDGVLELTSTGDEPYQIASLTVNAGATLTIPSGGLRVTTAVIARGGSIKGDGRLIVPMGHSLEAIAVAPGVEICRVPDKPLADTDYLVEPTVAAGVPGVPALWYDASRTNTFSFLENSRKEIWKWRDVRGEEHAYCTSYQNKDGSYRTSTLAFDPAGRPQCVYISETSSTAVENRDALRWSKALSGIRSVFKVLRPLNGGGPLLGGSNLPHSPNKSIEGTPYKDNYSTRKPLHSDPIFYSVPAAMNDTPVYINGDARDWRTGYPYRGGEINEGKRELVSPIGVAVPLLLEVHPPAGANVTANNFGYIGKFDNGMDMISEIIVYTNELSVAERLQVRKYLMNKWLDAELNAEPGEGRQLPTCEIVPGESLYVDAGTAQGAARLTGAGTFVKTGAGRLHLGDCSLPEASVQIAEGNLTVTSGAVPAREDLPGAAHIHVDASDEASFTFDANGRVAAWGDTRGAGYPGACARNPAADSAPTRVAEPLLGGRAVVDTGAHRLLAKADAATSGALTYAPVDNAHTVVGVLGSAEGGGALLGWSGTTNSYAAGYRLYGLARAFTADADAALPLVASNLYGKIYCAGFDNRPGGARTRVNAVDVAGGATGLSGGYDLVSFADYEKIKADCFGQIACSTTQFQFGGQRLAEMLVYTNVLSRASVRKVEAYLNAKWFGRTTVGWRPAVVGALAVDAGATLTLVGGAPVTAGAFVCAGSVSGAVQLTDGGTLTLAVADDGTVAPLAVSEGLGVSGSGTVRLMGAVAALKTGLYPLTAARGAVDGVWAAADPALRRRARLRARDGVLLLDVQNAGFVLFCR